MLSVRDLREGAALWRSHRADHEAYGVILPGVRAYLPDSFKRNPELALDELMAMDAVPGLSTEPNSAVPAMLTTLIDPEIFEILFAPNVATEIIGEKKKGDWLMETAMFPTAEATGEVSSYGDYSENGVAGVNINWPNRQSYLFQLIKQYGEREVERGGLARVNIVGEKDKAAALNLNKFSNFTYFFGVNGIQCYGLLNDPNLSAPLTPATKAAGGTAWIVNGVVVATANEIYNDIVSLYAKLVAQAPGLIRQDSPLTLALGPTSSVGLTATNSFNVNVSDLLKKNFPSMKINTGAVQYQARTASNPQGSAGGNLMQMICTEVEGQESAYCAFNEKMRAHRIIPKHSSWSQKVTAGTWGAIIRQPFAIAGMIGI